MKLRKKSPILICVDLKIGFLEEEYWEGIVIPVVVGSNPIFRPTPY